MGVSSNETRFYVLSFISNILLNRMDKFPRFFRIILCYNGIQFFLQLTFGSFEELQNYLTAKKSLTRSSWSTALQSFSICSILLSIWYYLVRFVALFTNVVCLLLVHFFTFIHCFLLASYSQTLLCKNDHRVLYGSTASWQCFYDMASFITAYGILIDKNLVI